MPDTVNPEPAAPTIVAGRVVTMNEGHDVIDDGAVYLNRGVIEAVQLRSAPRPAGFAGVDMLNTGGTLFPGMIELHNHISYNALPFWQPPKRYEHRGQWAGSPPYRKSISGPMQVLGKTPGYAEAIVRYVECKCLLAGVTTTQGMSLYSASGIRRFYKGLVRNVEGTDDPALPAARTKIADVAANDVERFFEALTASPTLLLHLSEGKGEAARRHFLALQRANGSWAITDQLIGIHCAALTADDFRILADAGGSMVWSPLSNAHLYGDTADIEAAKASGVNITLGSDWSPSGSRNLLAELKVADAYNQVLGDIFSLSELIDMVTRNPAKALKWQEAIGSIDVGKKADLFVVNGRSGDPYRTLINARESSLSLVIINGVARAGRAAFMERLGPSTETVRLGSTRRSLNLDEAAADPIVADLSLAEAQAILADGLNRLPELAEVLEQPQPVGATLAGRAGARGWFLDLDHEDDEIESARLHIGEPPPPPPSPDLLIAARAPLSSVLEAMKPDKLTVAGDNAYYQNLFRSRNLPQELKDALR